MNKELFLITLPGLQNRLDAMLPGEQLSIAPGTYNGLFGENDTAQRRLVHVAKRHDCSADVMPTIVTFHKLARRADRH